uniref:Tetraspanin n=1 Tax=Panagrolaimus sp. PS1159 TaxID=55785 RepID=A0AC35FZA1_9BILA
MTHYGGSKCVRTLMLIYTIGFWITGFALLFIGLWMLLDPRRTYILDLVDFSEDDPLLRFAAYISLITGTATILVAFLSCCGAIKAEKCMIFSFVIFLFLIFMAEISIGVLALMYREKIFDMNYRNHLKSIIHHDYGVSMNKGKNQQITKLIDNMQFYMKCCGAQGPQDWQHSKWRASAPIDLLDMDSGNNQKVHHVKNRNHYTFNYSLALPNVPFSCCTQMSGSTVHNLIAKSLVRCQQSGSSNKSWRHHLQQCCGGTGPIDYYNSFWYITNTERGTRSYVPFSCCRQTQNARAWALEPINPMCSIYFYNTRTFNSTVNTQGCHERLQEWFNEQSYIFAGVGIGFAFFQIIGIFLSFILVKQIDDYEYLH